MTDDRAPWTKELDEAKAELRAEMRILASALYARGKSYGPAKTSDDGQSASVAASSFSRRAGDASAPGGEKPASSTSVESRSDARAGATSGETGGDSLCARCGHTRGSHPPEYGQPPRQCVQKGCTCCSYEISPDPGPAKDAATDDRAIGLPTPAPQRGTATGALTSVEEEAERIAWSQCATEYNRLRCQEDILALVKREREAAVQEERKHWTTMLERVRQR